MGLDIIQPEPDGGLCLGGRGARGCGGCGSGVGAEEEAGVNIGKHRYDAPPPVFRIESAEGAVSHGRRFPLLLPDTRSPNGALCHEFLSKFIGPSVNLSAHWALPRISVVDSFISRKPT